MGELRLAWSSFASEQDSNTWVDMGTRGERAEGRGRMFILPGGGNTDSLSN